MENKHPSMSRHLWPVVLIPLVIIGVVVAFVEPGLSDTGKVILLGSGLLAAGIWGRSKLKQG